jgi:murein DD-endopeptidase MepM/ murein hydrolase activator NlpD
VKGDSIAQIAKTYGVEVDQLVAWNQLSSPDKIEVGQVLRVVPPTTSQVAVAKPVSTAAVTSTSLPPAISNTPASTAGTKADKTEAAATPAANSTAPTEPSAVALFLPIHESPRATNDSPARHFHPIFDRTIPTRHQRQEADKAETGIDDERLAWHLTTTKIERSLLPR